MKDRLPEDALKEIANLRRELDHLKSVTLVRIQTALLRATIGEVIYYTTPGADTFEKGDFPGARAAIFETQGGGGQGGGCDVTGVDEWSGGRGGDAGGYARSLVPFEDLDDVEAVTVGAGGSGAGAGATGNAGGDSVVDTISSEVRGVGGLGGAALGAIAGARIIEFTSGSTQAGGTGDLVIPGGLATVPGMNRSVAATPIGFGGGGALGFYSRPNRQTATQNTTGATGPIYGGGGWGGHNNESQAAARAGGPGGQGIVIATVIY